MRILVTGASGFVGSKASIFLDSLGYRIKSFSRTPIFFPESIEAYTAPTLSIACSASVNFLKNVDCVLHCAGRAHIMNDRVRDPLQAFRQANVYDTVQFAQCCASSGVRRFVYLSSAKVHGEFTACNHFFDESSNLLPSDPYSISKYEAESRLKSIASVSGMEVVIIRPPLIYGPGVKGNLLSLINLLSANLPLPLASFTHNRRSYISLANLLSFFDSCLTHPGAAGRVFLVSDQFDISTATLLNELISSMGSKSLLYPFPRSVLRNLFTILGKSNIYDRLSSSFVVDSSLATRLLGWSPPFTFRQGIKHCFSGSFLPSK